MKQAEAAARVVVGIDGSPDSHKALAWACEYAQAVGAELELVGTWVGRVSYGLPPLMMTFDPEEDIRAELEKAMAAVTLPHERVTSSAVKGGAGQVLVSRAREAALLVVGSRGLGGVTGALLGSVSTYCVHHATVPVVVVR